MCIRFISIEKNHEKYFQNMKIDFTCENRDKYI
jgi:hypothetical protein